VSKITFTKTWFGSWHISLFNKIDLVIGVKDGWGIGFDFSWYDRAITFDLIKIYIIIEKHWDLLDSLNLAVDADESQDKE
jgi:hypothetical protein